MFGLDSSSIMYYFPKPAARDQCFQEDEAGGAPGGDAVLPGSPVSLGIVCLPIAECKHNREKSDPK